jgi:3-hydroxypropanoate dehydrogenase
MCALSQVAATAREFADLMLEHPESSIMPELDQNSNVATAADAPPASLNVDEIVARKVQRRVDENALRSIFLEARSANGFLDKKIPRELLVEAVELAQIGPTSANGQPMRIVFVESAEAKERLRPALSPGNVAKTLAAPVTAIIAADLHFYELFPQTFPERAKLFMDMYAAMEPAARRGSAWDNALLQMGYFTVAVRALGLDAGPMGGFDRALVDAAFFPDGRWASQYLINLGYGDDTKVFPRLPRLNAREIARFA